MVCVLFFVYIGLSFGNTSLFAQSSERGADLVFWTWEGEPRLTMLRNLIEEFAETRPLVDVELVVRDYDSYETQLKLAIAGGFAPDIFAGDFGFSLDSDLIQAGVVEPMDDYEKRYRWDSVFPPSLLQMGRFNSQGTQWGQGRLWGVSMFGEIIGLFYNKRVLRELYLDLPTTFDEFQQTLQAVVAAGKQPIAFGNLEQYPAGFWVEVIAQATAETDYLRRYVFTTDETLSWAESEDMMVALELIQEWAKLGYFTRGYNGYTEDGAFERFVNDDALFFLSGPWYASSLSDAMGDSVGFFTLPSETGAGHTTTVALSGPLHIYSRSSHKELAAQLIAWLVGEEAHKKITAFGDLPATMLAVAEDGMSLSSIQLDMLNEYALTLAHNGVIPPFGYGIPRLETVLWPGLQELMAGRTTADRLAIKIDELRKQR